MNWAYKHANHFTIVLTIVLAGGLCSACFLKPNQRSTYRDIHAAAQDGNTAQIIADLKEKPESVGLRDDSGEVPLHSAAFSCKPDAMALLITSSTIDFPGDKGETPLHLAAQVGCTPGIDLLLTRGAQVNVRDKQGRTPLDRAQQWNKPLVVPLLRQHGGTE